VMMKLGGPDGPRPVIVTLATGKEVAIPVGGGFWAMFFTNGEPPRPLPTATPQRVVAEVADPLA